MTAHRSTVTSRQVFVGWYHAGLESPRHPLALYTQRLLSVCLAEHGQGTATINVLYCSKNRIRALKRDFLGIDEATDVLSFPSGVAPVDHEPWHLGDLALCLPVCATQARDHGRSTTQEVALLLVHGYLHLQGHDHDTAARRRRMWAETDRLLARAVSIRAPRLRVRGATS